MKRILSLASFVCAILFAVAGMIMPPQGEISGSVLILVAQLLILCATFLGIKDYHNIINRKLSWLKILKTSGASSSTLLWPPSPPCSRPLVSPSGDTPSGKPMNRPVWFVGVFLSTDHTENTEKDFRRMIKTTPSDFKPQTSDFIFALQALQYNNITVSKTHFCVTVVTVTVLKKQKQVRLDLMNRSSTKAWLQKIKTNDNFFFPHLLIFHFIFINLHGKS